jgi:hypothetical protein
MMEGEERENRSFPVGNGELRSRDLLEIDDEKLNEFSKFCEAPFPKSPHKHHSFPHSPHHPQLGTPFPNHRKEDQAKRRTISWE